jgi:hypothetical protein
VGGQVLGADEDVEEGRGVRGRGAVKWRWLWTSPRAITGGHVTVVPPNLQSD